MAGAGGCSPSRRPVARPFGRGSAIRRGSRPSCATWPSSSCSSPISNSTAATLAIAEEQLALHQRQLAGYEADQRFESGPDGRTGISRTVQHWRGVTLRIGLLYERAAVEFWGEVAAGVRSGDDVISRSALPGIAPGA